MSEDASSAPENEQAPPDRNVPSLSQLFLYQNSQTGQASSTQLSALQLCRLLCPAVATGGARIVTAETHVLALQADGSYSAWKPAKETPILQEALANWYYAVSSGNNGSTTQGPVSCRELARLYASSDAVTDDTRVYTSSPSFTVEWTRLGDLPRLQAALQALAPDNVQRLEQQPQETSPVVGDDAAQEVERQLQAFLHSRERADSATEYDSDGGTRYVGGGGASTTTKIDKKDATKPDTAPKRKADEAVDTTTSTKEPRPKKKKSKFSAKKMQCWVYVTGLPADTTEDEVAEHFSRAGVLDLNPQTQRPKIKLYRHAADGPAPGQCKGDASICYARPESVELAVTVLDESRFRPSDRNGGCPLHVERARFQQRGQEYDESKSKKPISEQQRKVAKLATLQAMDWDEGEINGRLTGGRKGLHIIVLKRMFEPPLTEDDRLEALEHDVRTRCEEDFGAVEKITIFAKHSEGVVIVKFALPGAASEAVKALHGQLWKSTENGDGRQRVLASFWDGVTDYTVRDEIQEKKEEVERHKEFGDWLDRQELPEELQLKTEDT